MESTTTAVAAPEGAPPKTGNLFDVLAHLLMTTRLSLEATRQSSALPRYVRIARINADDAVNANASVIEVITTAGVRDLSATISTMIKLALTARSLFGDTDSLKALIEVVLQLFKEASKLSFTEKTSKLFGLPSRLTPVGVDQTLSDIEAYIDFIPEPEDLDRIGHELFRMACVVHKKEGIDIDQTGKVRLLQWSFGLDWEISWNVKGAPVTFMVKHLGKRNLESTPRSGEVTVEYGDVPVYSYTGDVNNDDETEAKEILIRLNYTGLEDIRLFQFVNGLAVTGTLDVHTVNRLYNLDYSAKNLTMALAKPDGFDINDDITGGYLELVNGDADGYEDEGIQLQSLPGGYAFYQLGAQYNNGNPRAAWVVDPGSPVVISDEANANPDNLVHGFVGLISREWNPTKKEFTGGGFSEGEAASGKFFFAARTVAPWDPGRSGALAEGNFYLFNAKNSDAKKVASNPKYVSRMHQDIDLSDYPDLLAKIPANSELILVASCMRRSCYKDRTNGLPDQGRILLNLVNDKGVVKLQDAFKEDWLPNQAIAVAAMSSEEKEQKNVWFLQKSSIITIRKAGTQSYTMNGSELDVNNLKIRVVLEGRYMSGWDIDAYFDDVRVRWDYREIAP